jgi:hypothetical protein
MALHVGILDMAEVATLAHTGGHDVHCIRIFVGIEIRIADCMVIESLRERLRPPAARC